VASTHSHANRTRSIAWAGLLTLYMLGFINLFLRNSLGIMAPSISRDMALAPEALSIVASSFFFAYALMQIPSGMLLDRFGARNTLAFLLLFTTAGAAVFALAENTTQLILARILMGIGCAGIFSGAFFVINQWVTPDRVIRQTAMLNSFAAIGGLCATAPLAAVLAIYDWRLCFWVFTVGVGLILIAVLLGLKEPPSATAKSKKKHETLPEILAGVRRALAQPGIKRMLVIGIPLSTQTSIIGAWGAQYLRDVHHLDDVERGSVMLAMAFASVFGHSCYGFVAGLLNSIRNTIIAGSTLVILLLEVLVLIEQPPIWLVTIVFSSIGFLCMYPMLAFSHARSLIPTELVGRGIAITNMGIMTAIALSQLLFGWIVGLYPAESGVPPEIAYRAAFAALAAVSLAAVLIYAPIKDCKPRG
jgi:MFS family permease